MAFNPNHNYCFPFFALSCIIGANFFEWRLYGKKEKNHWTVFSPFVSGGSRRMPRAGKQPLFQHFDRAPFDAEFLCEQFLHPGKLLFQQHTLDTGQ